MLTLLTVNYCCCGCSLLVGSLMFLLYGLVMEVLRFVSIPWDTLTDGSIPYVVVKFIFYILRNLLYLGSQIIGIFAAGTRIPQLLIPVLISEVMAIVIAIFISVALIINGAGVMSFLDFDLTEFTKDIKKDPKTAGTVLIIYMILYYLITAGYNFYSFVVMFSFYKKLKEDRLGQLKGGGSGNAKPENRV